MILFIFNNKFPENSGFGIRCKRAIDVASSIDDVLILCRGNDENNLVYKNKNGTFPIHIFKPISPINDLAKNYLPGFYEVIRNIDLMFQLGITCISLLIKYRNNNLRLYVVNSPLTVPFVVLLLKSFFNVKPEIVEFHDLEPELALHIKNISKNNIVYKIELLLEKIVCRSFRKIIVTTEAQAKRIIERTGKNRNGVLIVPNTLNMDIKPSHDIKSNTIGYFSSFNYRYSTEGIIHFINHFKKLQKQIPNITFLLVGKGIGLDVIKDCIDKNKLSKHVIIKETNNSAELLHSVEICLIPWLQDEMTETMLPTKLFQYMAAKKVIVAPNFGEFKNVLSNNENAILFSSIEQCIEQIALISHNKKLKNKLAENAYKLFIEHYQERVFIKQFKSFIES